MTDAIQFVDLKAQRARLGTRVDEAIARVLTHAQFIMGPEVGELESRLASASGTPEVVSCASGTDALVLALMVRGVGRGDGVLLPSFTFAATAGAVAILGATPVFVDCLAASCNIDASGVEAAVVAAQRAGVRPVGVIGVDMFGVPADYAALSGAAQASGLWMMADAAQSFGARSHGVPVGSLAALTTTSFFPAKPLGCYGDGGAVFLASSEDALLMRSMRVHGQGSHKYENVRVGLNARLDTIQAAVLLAKLEIFDDELATRRAIARRYADGLANVVACPPMEAAVEPAWAQYTIRCADRDRIAAELHSSGLPTVVYYPTPLHRQPAFGAGVMPSDGLPTTERVVDQVLSLPMHPYLSEAQQSTIIAAVRAAKPTPIEVPWTSGASGSS